MLKLRAFGSNSPTSAVTLSQEYDEIQAANIFPSVQEDLSVSSHHANHAMDNSMRSKGSLDANGSEVEALKAQVESLRQQLAERDSTVNELQRQIQEDKRAHDKLKERYELFLGMNGSISINSTRRMNRDSDDCTSLSTGEMQRLHKHMDQLEAEKEASMRKVLKLSVMLAESKAKCCTLESQVDEYQSLLLMQNHANHNLAGAIVGKFMSPSTAVTPKKVPPATPSTVSTSTSASSATAAPITDINLNASTDFGVINLDSDDDDEENDNDRNSSRDLFNLDTDHSLAWAGSHPLSYTSERATSTRANANGNRRGQLYRSNTERGTMATTPRRNSAEHMQGHNQNKFSAGFRGFRATRRLSSTSRNPNLDLHQQA